MKIKLIFLFLVVVLLIGGCIGTTDDLGNDNGLNDLPTNIGTPGDDIGGDPLGLPDNIGMPPTNV
ncbi:MAG: hypothetical protein ISS82_02585 [Nanoarchaeota archaeon]|nr:hypothetical protein [Nanoarchaeota archaeon]